MDGGCGAVPRWPTIYARQWPKFNGVFSTVMGALMGAALWGLHLALTQGVLSKLVADVSPSDLRGTAFGGLNLAMGAAAFGSNAIAGALWSWSGPAATFGAGALFTAVAGVIAYQSRDTTGLGDVGFVPGSRGNIS